MEAISMIPAACQLTEASRQTKLGQPCAADLFQASWLKDSGDLPSKAHPLGVSNLGMPAVQPESDAAQWSQPLCVAERCLPSLEGASKIAGGANHHPVVLDARTAF